MKHLITNNLGGFRLRMEDFQFMQEAYKEAIKGMLSFTSEPVFIISGCEATYLSPGTWQISEGFVWIQNEMCYMPAHTFNLLAPNVIIDIYEEYDPMGLKVFKNSSEHEVYLNKIAKLRSVASLPVDGVLFSATKKIGEVIRPILNVGTWTLFSSPDSDAFFGGTTPDQAKRRWFKDIDSKISLSGLYSPPSSGLQVIGTLPVGARPVYEFDLQINLFEVSTETFHPVYCIVRSTGEIEINIPTGLSTSYFFLNQIPAFKS